jgi:hypothetical protein
MCQFSKNNVGGYLYDKFKCIYYNKLDSHLKTASVGIRKIQHVNKGCECPAEILLSWNSSYKAYFIKKYHPLHHKETEDEPLHDISENHYKLHQNLYFYFTQFFYKFNILGSFFHSKIHESQESSISSVSNSSSDLICSPDSNI